MLSLSEGIRRAQEAAWAKHGANHDFRYRHPVIFVGAVIAGLALVGAWLTAGMWHVPSVHLPHVSWLAWPGLGVWWWVLGAAGVLAGWRAVRWLTTY